jgi:hypothetical protein
MGAGETPDGFGRLPGVPRIASMTTSIFQRCAATVAYKYDEVAVFFFVFSVFATAATAAPPLAAAAIEPPPATQSASSRSP